ncbi:MULTISPECIES: hypothetical protein [Pseudomonas]|uniref:hypothetical protein n=1 Tax=Pseudomonas TaxID=286 RepID=UPI00257EFFE3|nr:MULTISPECIES: hypothetical protein [Pseudomonas]
MNDLQEAANCLRQLADTVSKLKDTDLAEDPEVMKQIDQFAIAMSFYHEQLLILKALTDAPSSTSRQVIRPSLYLVKR